MTTACVSSYIFHSECRLRIQEAAVVQHRDDLLEQRACQEVPHHPAGGRVEEQTLPGFMSIWKVEAFNCSSRMPP